MKETKPGSWIVRRRFMFAVSLFCAMTIAYVLWVSMTGAVAESAVTMSFITLMSIVGSYVFGATWDDKNFMTAQKRDNSDDCEPSGSE